MGSTIAPFVPVLAATRDRGSPAFRCSLAGAACYAGMLAITLTCVLPINSRLVDLPVDTSSVAELEALRSRWDRLHLACNVLNTAGLVCACLGAVSASRST